MALLDTRFSCLTYSLTLSLELIFHPLKDNGKCRASGAKVHYRQTGALLVAFFSDDAS
jgi:hypothetical protein